MFSEAEVQALKDAEQARMDKLRGDEELPLVFLDVAIKNKFVGRMVFALFTRTSPRSAENFRQLCTGGWLVLVSWAQPQEGAWCGSQHLCCVVNAVLSCVTEPGSKAADACISWRHRCHVCCNSGPMWLCAMSVVRYHPALLFIHQRACPACAARAACKHLHWSAHGLELPLCR